MFRSLILFLAIFTVSVSAATNVRKCTKDRPFPISVNIDGCETMPCDFIKGTIANMDAHFLGTRDGIKSMTTQIRTTVLGLTVPYALSSDIADVCANLMNGASCPIDKDEDVFYNFKFPIDDSYPEIPVKIEVSLVDDDTSETIACFIADIKVKKGNSSGGSRLS